MSEQPETIEDVAAGILNGVMIFLLGAVVPGAVVGAVVTHWGTLIPDLRSGSPMEAGQVIMLLGFSLLLMRTGFGLIRKNVLALWRRRRSSPAG